MRPSQPCLKPEAWLDGWLGLRSGLLGLRYCWLGLKPGWETDGRTNGRKVPPFYRTLAGWLAGPQIWLAGPQIWLAGPQAWLAGPQAWLAGPQAWLDGPEGSTDGRTDVQKISPFYRTLSPIGAAALPATMKTKKKVEQGKGTADHLLPLGYLFRFSELRGEEIRLELMPLTLPLTIHNCHTASANPHATDAALYTALFFGRRVTT